MEAKAGKSTRPVERKITPHYQNKKPHAPTAQAIFELIAQHAWCTDEMTLSLAELSADQYNYLMQKIFNDHIKPKPFKNIKQEDNVENRGDSGDAIHALLIIACQCKATTLPAFKQAIEKQNSPSIVEKKRLKPG